MTLSDGAPARFLWLLRPPVPIDARMERIFLLVGVAALFAGYDMNVFGLAIPQIQASLHIPENRVGLTVAYFRLAALAAMLVAASADLVGRRRLLLFTILGQAAFTLLTAFTTDYASFVWAQVLTRVFGYAEEMLCFVVIAEEVAAAARGWASGTISAFDYVGAGLASLVFAAVNILPYGWRAIYVIGAVPLFLVAWLRRRLPETRRFERQHADDAKDTGAKTAAALALLRELARQYPVRVLTILIAAGAFGFAVSPAAVLAQKYLQDVYRYTPGQVTLLLIPGGLAGLGLSILAGRLSDRLGRRRVTMAIAALAGVCFFFFYGGAPAGLLPVLWILAFFGFFSGEALIAGFALEIVPTRYRATVAGLRYVTYIGAGAAALALEGILYDKFASHGRAIQTLLAAMPITVIAILFLPEPAGKVLEEIA
ncbi:MAG TPA: MFS transporter [Rhizomicrobium sp.]|nr:MFS transporter [Rhizomicrobium sp.]